MKQNRRRRRVEGNIKGKMEKSRGLLGEMIGRSEKEEEDERKEDER